MQCDGQSYSVGRTLIGMKRVEIYRRYLGRLLWLLMALLSNSVVAKPGEMSMGAKEQTFPVLETKTGAYTNVTVTKKTKDWIFILHSKGVCNVKAADLNTEARIALGYEEAPDKDGKPKEAKPSAAPFAQLTQHLKLEEVRQFATDWRQNRKETLEHLKAFLAANPMAVCAVLGIVAVVYIFFIPRFASG